MRNIALVDHTRRHRPPAGVLDAIAEALTIQLARDLAPAWRTMAPKVSVGGHGQPIHIFDSAHQATDYGWHTVDSRGQPYAHVFVHASLANGNDWLTGRDAVALSIGHEALEMLVDPGANSFCFDGLRRLWACEICDPVQERSYRIVAGGHRVPVSDFVLPAYFNPWATGPYDHLGELKAPFTIDKGGYAVFQRSGKAGSRARKSFDVVFSEDFPEWLREHKADDWGRTYWRRLLAGG